MCWKAMLAMVPIIRAELPTASPFADGAIGNGDDPP
jgi:hypothetical protein